LPYSKSKYITSNRRIQNVTNKKPAKRAFNLKLRLISYKDMHTLYGVESTIAGTATQAAAAGGIGYTLTEPVSVAPSSKVTSSCLANLPKIPAEQTTYAPVIPAGMTAWFAVLAMLATPI
jgi:hypothetical protein